MYQSTEQLKNGEQLGLKNPPMRKVLEMEECPVDKNGFSSYKKFEEVLKNAGNKKCWNIMQYWFMWFFSIKKYIKQKGLKVFLLL